MPSAAGAVCSIRRIPQGDEPVTGLLADSAGFSLVADGLKTMPRRCSAVDPTADALRLALVAQSQGQRIQSEAGESKAPDAS